MLTDDRALRARCSALLGAISDYQLERLGKRGTGDLLHQLHAIRENQSCSVDLENLRKRFANEGGAAFSVGLRHGASNAPLFLSLHTFTARPPDQRLFESSRWIALTRAFVRGESKITLQDHLEVFEYLERKFKEESRKEASP